MSGKAGRFKIVSQKAKHHNFSLLPQYNDVEKDELFMSNMIQSARQQVAQLTQAAYEKAAGAGLLPAGAQVSATIEIPKDTAHGDYASSFAMAGARALHMAPRQIAQIIADNLELEGSYFQKVDGVLNSRLIESIVDSENMRGNAFVARGVCGSYRVEYNEAENPASQLLDGHLVLHMYMSPFPPAEVIEDIRIVSALLSGTGPDALRTICEQVKDMRDDTIIVVAGTLGDKATIAASCGEQAVKKGAHAGNLVRAVAKIAGGSGGGRPDSAMAGAKDLTKLDEALEAVSSIVNEMINK